MRVLVWRPQHEAATELQTSLEARRHLLGVTGCGGELGEGDGVRRLLPIEHRPLLQDDILCGTVQHRGGHVGQLGAGLLGHDIQRRPPPRPCHGSSRCH